MAEHLYQVLHSPPGAGAAFALGYLNHGGGFGIEQDKVPEQDVFIGIRRGGNITCLPFFKDAESLSLQTFVQRETDAPSGIRVYAPQEIRHILGYGSDTYETQDLSFSIFSPVKRLPDPESATPAALRDAFAPALIARLVIDNTGGSVDAEGVFAVSPMMGKEQLSCKTGGALAGFISRDGYGFAALNDAGVEEFCDFGLMLAYSRPRKQPFLISTMASLAFSVAAGKKREITLALGWYRGGTATSGLHECRYFYTNLFTGITDVLEYAIGQAESWRQAARMQDEAVLAQGLDENRRFLLCQSAHCYYYSSMLFDDGGQPRWVVNEGTFRMMNTFDLFVDHVFFELRYHPWAVRNQLDSYLCDYSYYDHCGLTFTHDQGVHNVFTPKGYSGYELPHLKGCFSYMSQEQLCNWVLAAALYVHAAGDGSWAALHKAVFVECLSSMQNRDSLEGRLTGIMRVDSSRCEGGSEITTYDSLDESLGQARENLYIAVKCWAAYLALQRLMCECGDTKGAVSAQACARRCADSIIGFYDPVLRYIPALLDGKDTSAIIPAIEALIYPARFGASWVVDPAGPYGDLISTLKKHMETVLHKGLCLFPDGGWKLSANSDNSWMSKIFISEYVAEFLLGIPHDYARADKAHADWWRIGCPSNPGIDQLYSGTQKERNFHYPRCVTSILWREGE